MKTGDLQSTASLSHLRHVVLVADASESAASNWKTTIGAVRTLVEALPDHCVRELYILGCDQLVPLSRIRDVDFDYPEDLARTCSLVAHIIRVLTRRHRHTQAVVIVGNGEVFDLADWINYPLVDRWVLVRSGTESLQGSQPVADEVEADQLEDVYAALRAPVGWKTAVYGRRTSAWSSRSFSWVLDTVGYPMIWIESIEAFVHLFPVGKAQFERFLSRANLQGSGDLWYAELLSLNPRASYRAHEAQPYEGLFLTGILPDEAVAFAQWMGEEYSLLCADEWCATYEWLQHHPSSAVPPSLYDQGLSEDAYRIWEIIENELHPHNLLELALMSKGVMEWVTDNAAEGSDVYAGLGLPRDSFWPSVRTSVDTVRPIRPERRLSCFGFRLQRGRP